MRKVQDLAEHIREEITDAEKYARAAMEHRDTDKQLADMYMRLADGELAHARMEHDQAVRIIRERKDAGEEIPKGMMEMWEWEHRIDVEDEAAVRVLMEMYRS